MEIDKEEFSRIAKKFGIKYAILFGSFAKNYAWEESDVDIAIKVEKLPKNFREKLKLKVGIERGIEKIVKKDVDVVFMNELNPGFKFEIIKEGLMIYVDNFKEWVEEKARIIGEYHDYKEFIKEFEERLIKWWKAV